jgi:acetyl-CoA carboxylase biotin carboxylase subunit
LGEYRIVGLPTLIPFHQWLVEQDAFRRGEYDTAFLPDRFSLTEPDREPNRALAALVAVLLSHEQRQRVRLEAESCVEGEEGAGWRSDRAWRLVGRREAMGA